MNLEEDDVVLCTVNKIQGTTVFLDIDDYPGILGTMIFAEVSAGRIRNIREFVVPGKKIVCKVLRIKENNIELSLRRVTGKEREGILERYKKEKQFQSVLKTVLKEDFQNVYEKIKEDYNLIDFIEEVRENQKVSAKYMSKEQSEQLSKILSERKEKEKEVTRILILKTLDSQGINKIKEVLNIKDAEIKYKGSSQFLIKTKAKDFKIANQQMENILEEIKKKSKERNIKLEIKEK